MVALKDDLVYVALPGDPLKNLATARHFFGDNFKVYGEKDVLVFLGLVLDAHLKLQEGLYQTYHAVNGKLIPWELLSISKPEWNGHVAYKFIISKELWCVKNLNFECAYFPDENSRILFEKYFGIR